MMNAKSMKRRALCVAALALICVAGPARAAEAAAPGVKLAVLSLIGDQMSYVGYNPSTGSLFNQNARGEVQIPNSGFDATALRTIQHMVKDTAPGMGTVLYAVSMPKLAADPTSLFANGKAVIPPGFVATMKKDGASQALLLTRRRGEAILRAYDDDLGTGKVEGVGYYLDRTAHMHNMDTGFSSRGFLAPYVWLQLTRVDLDSGRILAEQAIGDSVVLAANQSQGDENPWQIVPDARKIDQLNEMIEQGVRNSMAKVLPKD